MCIEEAVDTASFVLDQDKHTLKALLSDFPGHLEKWFWAPQPNQDAVLQGDLVNPVCLPVQPHDDNWWRAMSVPAIVLSNSCDVSQQKDSFITVAPVVPLEQYREQWLAEGGEEAKWDNWLDALERNRITRFVYLPETDRIKASIARLDRAGPVAVGDFTEDDFAQVHTLSRFGHYLLLMKVAWHFNRPESADAQRVVPET